MKQQVQSLNFTGKQAIDGEHVLISGFAANSDSYLMISKFDVEEYKFESNAKVVIEVWTTRYGMTRFDAGELQSLDFNKQYAIDIDANGMRSASVDINVVSTKPETRHKILGSIKRIRVSVDGRKVSILPHIERSLGGEVWRLEFDFDDSGLPVLCINSRIEDATQLVESKDFRAIVMPVVVEKIAQWLLERQKEGDLEDAGIKKWEVFFKNLGWSIPDVDDDNERKEFPENVAKTFAEEHDLITKYLDWLEGRAN
jgi:hypothetical protein